MGIMVTCPIVNISPAGAADDIFELATPAGKRAKLHGFELYSDATAAAALRLRLLRRTTGGNGSAATEALLDPDDGTILCSVETNAAAPGSAGAVLKEFYWEQLGPLVYLPPPALQPIVDVSGFLCLEMTTDGSAQNFSGWLAWEEL